MLNPFRFLLVISVFIFAVTSIKAQLWYAPRDESGKRMYDSFALARTNDSALAIAQILGIRVTSDAGKSWRHLWSYNVLELKSSNRLYGCGGLGNVPFIYISDDNGENWRDIATLDIDRGFAIDAVERSPDTIVVEACNMGGVAPQYYMTTNGGASWTKRSSGESLYLHRMLVGADENLYAVHRQYGVYTSADNGGTWLPVVQGIDSGTFNDLARDASGKLYVASDKGRFYISTNNGAEWKKVSVPFDTTESIQAIDIAPDGGVYIVGGGGELPYHADVYRSYNDGFVWEHIGSQLTLQSTGNITYQVTPQDLVILGDGTVVLIMNFYVITNNPNFGAITSVQRDNGAVPSEVTLGQNFPNPFNPETEIPFRIPVRSHVKLTVYSMLGQKVADLTEGRFEAGSYSVRWVPKTSSGIYFCRMEAVALEGSPTRHSSVIKLSYVR